jgi:hypothetical protein
MLVSQIELSLFNRDSIMQILESKSVFVCEMPLNNGFKLHLYSISNYFVEELLDSFDNVVEVKPVSTYYVASLYCGKFNLSKQIL